MVIDRRLDDVIQNGMQSLEDHDHQNYFQM